MVGGNPAGKSNESEPVREISNPSLTHSNALPRDDIQPGKDVLTAQVTPQATPQLPEWDEPQRPNASSNPLQSAGAAPKHSTNGNGVIFSGSGNPSSRPLNKAPQTRSRPSRPAPRSTPSKQRSSPSQQRPSKWEKLGGLFKTKKEGKPPSQQPIYQVRVNDRSMHDVSKTANSWEQSKPRDWLNATASKTKGKGEEAQPKKSQQLAHRAADKPKSPVQPESTKLQTNEQKPGPNGTQPPLLQVEIPKVEMERYSVMFGGLLSERQPPLLARRSKPLERLSIIGEDEVSTPSDSSGRTPKSPSFSLFPPNSTQVSKAAKVLGTQNIPLYSSSPLRVPSSPEMNGQRRLPNGSIPSPDKVNETASGVSRSTRDLRAVSTSSMDVGTQGCLPFQLPKSNTNPKKQSSSRPKKTTTTTNREIAAKRTRSKSEPGDLASKVPRSKYAQNPVQRSASRNQSARPSPLATRSKTTPSVSAGPSQRLPISSPMKPARFPPGGIAHPLEQHPKNPNFELSIARSVSVSKAKNQLVVPIGTRTVSEKQKGKMPEVMPRMGNGFSHSGMAVSQ